MVGREVGVVPRVDGDVGWVAAVGFEERGVLAVVVDPVDAVAPLLSCRPTRTPPITRMRTRSSPINISQGWSLFAVAG